MRVNVASQRSSKTVSDDAIQHLFETICADHRKTVRRVARQFVRDASVMDVEQEALWVAYRKLPQLRDTRAVRAWLATLTRRIALRHLNRKARQLGDVKSSDEEREIASDDQAATSFSEWEGRFENVSLLRQLCGSISPGDLAILVGLHVEDRSLRDIAGEVGLSEVNVKVRAHRARNRLMKELEKGENS
jgi:RNA polymerase sigma-70 factor (ECF subfamily)